MDKRKVILAYRRGFITLQECAQILGVDSVQTMMLVHDPLADEVHRPSQVMSVSSARL